MDFIQGKKRVWDINLLWQCYFIFLFQSLNIYERFSMFYRRASQPFTEPTYRRQFLLVFPCIITEPCCISLVSRSKGYWESKWILIKLLINLNWRGCLLFEIDPIRKRKNKISKFSLNESTYIIYITFTFT